MRRSYLSILLCGSLLLMSCSSPMESAGLASDPNDPQANQIQSESPDFEHAMEHLAIVIGIVVGLSLSSRD